MKQEKEIKKATESRYLGYAGRNGNAGMIARVMYSDLRICLE